MPSANLIDALLEFFDREIAEIAEPTRYIWGAKESTDKGQSWIKTTRLDVYQQAREVVKQLAETHQSGASEGSRSRRRAEPDPAPAEGENGSS